MKTLFDYKTAAPSRRFIFIATAALTFAGAAAWMLSTGYCADDFLYCREVLPACDNYFWDGVGPMIENFSQIGPSFVNHWELINSRLANFLHILFQLLPRSVEMAFSAVMLMMMFLGVLAVGQGSRRLPGRPVLALAVIMTWCALPWYDHMQSADYLANYVWTSALWMPVLWMLPSLPQMSLRRLLLFYGLAAPASVMHESFTCVMVAFVFFFVLAAPGRLWRCRRYWIFEAEMLLCVGLTFVSGMSERVSVMAGNLGLSALPYFASRYSSACWPLLLACVAVVVCALRLPRARRRGILSFLLACIGAAAVSLLIALTIGMMGRALWPMALFSMLALLRVAALLWPDGGAVGRPGLVVWSALLIVYAMWFVELVRWQRVTIAEQHAVEEIARGNGPMRAGDIIYYDFTHNEQRPFYLMSMADNNLADFTVCRMIASFAGHENAGCLAIFPSEYAGEPIEAMPEVDGVKGLHGVWPFYVSRDTLALDGIRLLATDFMPQATPIDRALVLAADRSLAPAPRWTATYMKSTRLDLPDGTRGYCWFPGTLRRLVRGRRVDTIRADSVAAPKSALSVK